MKVREVQEKLLGTKTFFLLNFWDINNQLKKVLLGCQNFRGGGGVTLIRAMPRFKLLFLCVCSLRLEVLPDSLSHFLCPFLPVLGS